MNYLYMYHGHGLHGYNEFPLGEIFPSPIEDSLATFNPADL